MSARAVEVWLVTLLAAASGGCQWILDDIEGPASDAERRSGAGDASAEEEGSSREAGVSPSTRRDGASDEPLDPGGRDGSAQASIDAAQGTSSDAAVAGLDAGAGTGVRDAEVRDAAPLPDSSEPAPDVVTTCSEPVLWYADGDGDGYGRSSAMMRACPAPSGSWTQRAGDCNDDDPRVHPDQPGFFDEPYQAPDGSLSFDFDCSGAEEGNGQQSAAPAACGPLELTACSGSGYVPIARAGAMNRLCGSHRKMTCTAAVLGLLVCEGISEDVIEPYWCR